MNPRAPLIDIGKLRLHLPAAWGARAPILTRLIGEQLANKPWATTVARDQVELRGLRLPAEASDLELATAISSAIFARLERAESGGEHG